MKYHGEHKSFIMNNNHRNLFNKTSKNRVRVLIQFEFSIGFKASLVWDTDYKGVDILIPFICIEILKFLD